MAARAILTCRPNSHPFQDRGVSLDQPVKIGRSVARARPQSTNAIFDCKVLSRNHALLWYDNGKFYLQDTKSSNGTFVNNQRLSKSSEESPPREVSSGDIVQFGVDVMELNKKVTHGCIVATLQLFLPDGKEAKASSSTALPEKVVPYSVQEIYQLNQYIKEAIQREQMIENKLATINQLMASTKDSVDSNWKVLIEEDRLLTRVDILERQLQTSHKTMTDDKLQQEVLNLHEDKEKYQIVAKEICWNVRCERMEALKNLQDVQKTLNNAEEEKSLLKDMYDQNCQELKELVEKYEQSELKSKDLVEQMDQSSVKYKEELESLNNKIKEGELLLEDKQQLIDSLMTKINTENSEKDPVTTTHNEDLTDFSLSGLKMDIMNDHDSKSKGDVQYPSIQIQTLTNQLKSTDSERKEILSKLSHLLNIIEDLKTVSNKVQASEFMQELIHKLDVEIRQIRNFSQGEEQQLNNSYINMKVEPTENKTENNIDCCNSDGFEKLLDESRQISKVLQTENVGLKKEKDILEEQVTEFASQLKTYQDRAINLGDANAELQSRINFLQSQVESSEKDSFEFRQKLETMKGYLKEREDTIVGLMAQRDTSSFVETACQTINNLIDNTANVDTSTGLESRIASQVYRTNFNKIDDLSSQGSESSEQKLSAMNEKLLQFEEELATYKTVYNESASENITLRQKIADLQSQHKAIHDQSKLMFFCCSFPVLILIVAVFLAFYPSISIWTGTAF